MQWDIFCKVIDNHGDLGVCWRLCCQLAMRGLRVRLWVDEGSALQWMAPEGCAGVTVIDWSDPDAVKAAAADAPPDVLIEAFGCDPAPELVERFADSQDGTASPHSHRPWINLEYLSAEPYVERLHGLPSPVFRGPGAGLTKRFFYPGFTAGTGGLLREPDLMAQRARFDRAAWLAEQQIEWHGERLISLFCYEPPALAALLNQLVGATEPTRLLVTAGRATLAVQACLSTPAISTNDGGLSVSYLPHFTQSDFDRLLWACDLNFVRGEDSFVRALWAGAPMVWQIYPQDDDAHHVKLGAWLDWLDAPPSLRALHRAWNGFGAVDSAEAALPKLKAEVLTVWQVAIKAARERLFGQDDLVTQLMRMCAGKS
ncbi:elongation factor P maturation arginine rhamnosyltransferase EarP [soil metagenome]